MPPGGSEKLSADAVGERGTRSDRALADSGDTIIPGSCGLQEAVPMHRRAFILKLVLDCDFNPVTPVGLDERTRELVVDNEHRSDNTVWLHCSVCNSPVVLAGDTCVRYLAWVVRVGVVGVPVSPWPNATTRLGAIEVTI